MTEPKVTIMPKSAWKLLGPGPGRCQVCAVDHAPEQPHNPQSLFWRTARNIADEPSPTWEDALEHCPPEVREAWVAALAERGVMVAEASK